MAMAPDAMYGNPDPELTSRIWENWAMASTRKLHVVWSREDGIFMHFAGQVEGRSFLN
jgi:hypothetical protein